MTPNKKSSRPSWRHYDLTTAGPVDDYLYSMLPIGDHYTMGPREAAYACNLLKPKAVIPMHFGTFPVLTGRPSDLQKLVPNVEVIGMKPGTTLTGSTEASHSPARRTA